VPEDLLPDQRAADRPAARGRNAQLDHWMGALRGAPHGSVGGLLLLLAALIIGFSLYLPDRFPRAATFQSMMFQLPELGLLSLAMVLPLISGGLNLAIIATANQAALLMAYIMTTMIAPDAAAGTATLWVFVALAAGFLLCLGIGLITGFLVATMGVHPILVTLGTMSVVNGVSIYLTHGTIISHFPEGLLWVANGTVVGIPASFFLLLAAAFAVHVLLTRAPIGIHIHMAGSNLEATRYSGIDTRRVLIAVYTLSSLLCWLAAVVMMARFNSASADYAQSYLLITILAAILGGVDPFGGFGRIVGLIVSLIVLQVIASGLNLLQVSQHLTLAIWGLTLILIMAAKFLVGAWRGRTTGR
jgi:simple sugar transport system permease protein